MCLRERTRRASVQRYCVSGSVWLFVGIRVSVCVCECAKYSIQEGLLATVLFVVCVCVCVCVCVLVVTERQKNRLCAC